MLIIPNTTRGRRRRTTNPAPAVPVLVAAEYLQDAGYQLRLTFDRAVNVGGVVDGAVRLFDGTFAQIWYYAHQPTQTGPESVIFELSEQDAWAEPGVRMTATPVNGIVAADTGAAWAGVTDLELPFGI